MVLTSSLIISTYNWPKALELVLRSVKNQNVYPTEVIIADDGSNEETRVLIEEFKKDFPIPLIHIWHEDKGFRLAEIRNKAITKVKSDYVIQVDGDTILHKDFVKDHLNTAKKGFFTSGSRVLVNEVGTRYAEKQSKIYFHVFSKNITNRLNTLRVPFLISFFEKRMFDCAKASSSVRGCNMSFWLSDLQKVNGYNEKMTGWGFEDWELSARLINSGLGKKRIKFGAIQFHLHHTIQEKKGLNINEKIYNKAVENCSLVCKDGLLKL